MDHPLVKFTVYQSGELVQTQECGADASNTYQVPNMPTAEERAAILGSSDSTELLEQQKYIEQLLDSLTNAGTQANSALTRLMESHSASAATAVEPEDYSSGEDMGDPNEIAQPPKAKRRKL